MNPLLYEEMAKRALEEDIGFEDLTTEAIVSPFQESTAEIIVKEEGVLAGIGIAETCFRMLDPEAKFTAKAKDGEKIFSGQVIATVSGRTRAILSAERTALNFLQRLSGIATSTQRAVEIVKDFNCRIVDTRKTTPGLRALEKYAVRVGGGFNHRFGLYDAVLIKDNHIQAAGGILKAVSLVQAKVGHMVKIEVETETLDQVREALSTGADIIMLDNMSLALMKEAVALINGQALTEASGGITLDKLAQVAATGVDLISLGWLTHSARSLDISLDFA